MIVEEGRRSRVGLPTGGLKVLAQASLCNMWQSARRMSITTLWLCFLIIATLLSRSFIQGVTGSLYFRVDAMEFKP
jgi:hypothetical protein